MLEKQLTVLLCKYVAGSCPAPLSSLIATVANSPNGVITIVMIVITRAHRAHRYTNTSKVLLLAIAVPRKLVISGLSIQSPDLCPAVCI